MNLLLFYYLQKKGNCDLPIEEMTFVIPCWHVLGHTAEACHVSIWTWLFLHVKVNMNAIHRN